MRLTDLTHPVFDLSSSLVDEYTQLQPASATYYGLTGHDDRWEDLSPEGHATMLAALRDMRRRVDALPEPVAHWDNLAIDVAASFLDTIIAGYERNEHHRDLDSIASSAQSIVEVFDHMDKKSVSGWENVCARLEKMDDVLGGYRQTLAEGVATGESVARRQVVAVAEQSRVASSEESGFEALPRELTATDLGDDALMERLVEAVKAARAAQAALGEWLKDAYLPTAVAKDAVGEERYVWAARRFLGTEIDPIETYSWGWSEVATIRARMQEVASQIVSGGSIADALQTLKSDPARAAATRADFIAFMEQRSAAALKQLDGSHFDVPDNIKRVEVKLANPGGPLGAYYVGPSEDFTRPGAVWWSHGTHPGPFPLYDEVSTLYHEGFPGHHLQVGMQVSLADRLSRLHRMLVWLPGIGEGWALYAERLMDDLGFLDKPDYVFGYLAAQMLRACRVVIDIGSHLELTIPDGQPFHPGESWSFELGVEMLETHATLEKQYAQSEMTRYLGWPGQAISYKVGEREILSIREQLEARPGFEAKEFHQNLLEIGPVGIDLLRRQLLG